MATSDIRTIIELLRIPTLRAREIKTATDLADVLDEAIRAKYYRAEPPTPPPMPSQEIKV